MPKFAVEKGKKLTEVLLITPTIHTDNRGFFVETYNTIDFKEFGTTDHFIQDGYSHSTKNVLRGLHFQLPPCATSKLVCCFSGEVFDVAVDLRPDSPTFKQWEGFSLSGDSKKMLYIPIGFAHGFYVKSNTADIFYKTHAPFRKDYDGGVHWSDPEINITWPAKDPVLSEKDSKRPFVKDILDKLKW
jgi:dTDP-4-dehydrorhamnose 3,5-epimerase